MFVSKKKFNKIVDEMQQMMNALEVEKNELKVALQDACIKIDEYAEHYPFEIGQIVYDVQLRNDKGRFTKVKPSREHSMINEVVVDKKNYFGLVDRLNNNDVFVTLYEAEQHLNNVCK